MRGTNNTFGGDAYTDWRLDVQNDAAFRITSPRFKSRRKR